MSPRLCTLDSELDDHLDAIVSSQVRVEGRATDGLRLQQRDERNRRAQQTNTTVRLAQRYAQRHATEQVRADGQYIRAFLSPPMRHANLCSCAHRQARWNRTRLYPS